MVKFRQAERAQHLETLKELVEEARKRAKSHYTSSKERARWVKLTGQLLWYRDQVLRSLNYEALEKEVADLKELVLNKDKPSQQKPPWARQLNNNEKTQSTD
jgi:hypothetical protein